MQDENWENIVYLVETLFGKTLSASDTRCLLYIYDTLGFEIELFEYLVEYCATMDKKSCRYMEATAIGWYQDGIRTKEQAKEQHAAALTVQEIRSMGKKTITGNVSFTPSECNILKDYAVTGLLVKAENSRLEEKLRSAQCSAAIWKQRYDALYNAYQELKKEVQPYLDAVKLAPEKVRAFFDELLTRTRQARQPTKPIRRKQDMER